MEHQVIAHKLAVSASQGRSKNGTDPNLKAFAVKTQSIIQTHRKMAQEIVGGLKESGKGGAGR